MRPHLLVLALALALTLHSAAAFFDHNHNCGDADTRQHILKACRNALWKLDSMLPPSIDEALDHHNVRNFEAALKSPTLKAARKDANQCAMCVLHGFSNCDIKLHDSGCGTPGLEHEHAFGFTDLSQNCKDHVTTRNKLKAGFGPAFRMHEIHLDGSHTLKAKPAAVQWTGDFILAETDAGTTDDAPPVEEKQNITRFTGPTGLWETINKIAVNITGDEILLDDPNLTATIQKISSDAGMSYNPVNQEATTIVNNQLDVIPDVYVCALVNDTKQVDFVCPTGYKIDEILYASYGTPLFRYLDPTNTSADLSAFNYSKAKEAAQAILNGKSSLTVNGDLALAEAPDAADSAADKLLKNLTTEFAKNGYLLFSGDLCYAATFQDRQECSAYNSRDVVEFACKGSSKCTLRATGDPKVFPNTFQALTCDAQLQLYVKARCKSDIAAMTTESQSTAELIRNWQIEVQKEVNLDFNDPNQMDFLPGVIDVKEEVRSVSREDKFAKYKDSDGVIQRPIVREQINPPSDYYPNFILTGAGQSSFRCEDSGVRDADGNIYIWRPNGAEPKNTWMRYYDEDNKMVAEWDLETNTYKWLEDGSTIVPEQFPVGEVTDTGVTDGVQNHFENAPDNLYHAQTTGGNGMFTGIKYIQRYQSIQGVPPKEDGIVVLAGNKQWFRCKNGQNLQERIMPMTATYFFYSQDAHYAEKARGAPYWVWIIVGVAGVMLITLIAGVVYWKVKGAPKFISRKKAYEGSYDKSSEAANRLQRTLLYGEDEQNDDLVARTEAL